MVDSSCWSQSYLDRRRAKMQRAGLDYAKCPRGGTVNIDGKDYCCQHAGQIALAMLLGEPVDWKQPGDLGERAEVPAETKRPALCQMPNCVRIAPAGEAFCKGHRGK